ncbi:MAG: hypothetical protein K0Q51_1500 [Rickettsiaceae bacterium]|nr:hypothetical protein [Rickettsiaceae bacterium]
MVEDLKKTWNAEPKCTYRYMSIYVEPIYKLAVEVELREKSDGCFKLTFL